MSNEAERERARQEGRDTFRCEVVEDWPGCVECGQPIRRTLPGRDMHARECGCPGAVWRCDIRQGWVREYEPVTRSAAERPGS